MRCTDHSGRVTRVSFVNKAGLAGSVADLMALSALTHLELAGCSSVAGNVGGTAALATARRSRRPLCRRRRCKCKRTPSMARVMAGRSGE